MTEYDKWMHKRKLATELWIRANDTNEVNHYFALVHKYAELAYAAKAK
jgi:hypothetical protein